MNLDIRFVLKLILVQPQRIRNRKLVRIHSWISFDLEAGAGWITEDETRAVLPELEMCTWSMDISGSRSTSLEEEELGAGAEGPTKVIPLRVVITLISSMGLDSNNIDWNDFDTDSGYSCSESFDYSDWNYLLD
ncbi:hypothetical protein Tco_0893737 [Tanacetum coccineum]|uniref:Uncharacterized protein n=1 Tax=Tanacetum coccineum TaxID=301880 RepID=A0ABQ5C9P9_9ASTR